MPCEYFYVRQCVKLTFFGDRYETVEGSTTAGINVPPPSSWTVEDVESWLLIHAAAANGGNPVDRHADLFAQGFDR